MKKLIAALVLLALLPISASADCLTPGSASTIWGIVLRSTTDNTGVTGKVYTDVTASYWRPGSARSAITTATLAATTTAYTSGGFKEIDATNMPGTYRFDLPDAALATGVPWVEIDLKVTGAYVYKERIQLAYCDNESAAPASSTAGSVNARLKTLSDARGTAQSVTGTTIVFASTENFGGTGIANQNSVVIVSATTGAGQTRCIKTYVDGTDTATVDTWNPTPTGTITYDLIATPNCNTPTTAGAQKTADVTLRRATTNVEASADGDTLSRKSLYGAVAKQTHRIKNETGALKIYKADGTTILSSQALTTNSAAPPITEIGD